MNIRERDQERKEQPKRKKLTKRQRAVPDPFWLTKFDITEKGRAALEQPRG